jgi:DNA-binding winged helix-turn-helix (wHTH) protein
MSSAKLRFRDYELDPDGFELCRAGHRLRLERKPLELLILLAENQGQLVKREKIIEKIWGKDFFFDAENGINNAIRKIRSALHDNAEHPLYVETPLGKGYRFIAPVERISDPTSHQERGATIRILRSVNVVDAWALFPLAPCQGTMSPAKKNRQVPMTTTLSARRPRFPGMNRSPSSMRRPSQKSWLAIKIKRAAIGISRSISASMIQTPTVNPRTTA